MTEKIVELIRRFTPIHADVLSFQGVGLSHGGNWPTAAVARNRGRTSRFGHRRPGRGQDV